MKQYLIIRKDLKMKPGKLAAQAAHASMKATVLHMDNPKVKEWLGGIFTKVALAVESEEELLEIINSARSRGVIAELITDAGITVFNGVPTNTCAGIGPDDPEVLKEIVGHLKLL